MMSFIKNIFWNGDQHRVRALWRLIGQIILLALITLPVQGGLGFVAVMFRTSQVGITLSPMTLLESPLVMTLLTLGIFLAILISVWLAGRLLDRRSFADFGLHMNRNWWTDFGFGLLLGACLMLLIFVIELVAGWLTVEGILVTRNPDVPFLLAILLPLLTFAAVGFYEELFSRGYQLRNMAEGLNWKAIGPRWAIVIATLLSSALFGLMHLGNPNASLISSLNISLAGAILRPATHWRTGNSHWRSHHLELFPGECVWLSGQRRGLPLGGFHQHPTGWSGCVDGRCVRP